MSGKEVNINLKKAGIIPGLRGNDIARNKLWNQPTLSLFVGGQMTKNGLNGGLFGVAGNIPLADNGLTNLYVQGGVGNIFQGRAEISHKIPLGNNSGWYIAGSAGVEGTVSLTDNKDYTTSSSNDITGSHYLSGRPDDESSTISSQTLMPFDNMNIIYNGREPEHPDYVDVITQNHVKMSTSLNGQNLVENQTNLANNILKGNIKGELRYEGDNFYVGAGVKFGVASRFIPETTLESTDPKITTDKHSNAVYNEYSNDAMGYFVPTGYNTLPHHWSYVHRYIDIDETVDLNNISMSTSQATKYKLQAPEFSITPSITAGYQIGNLLGTLDADLESVRVGLSYNFDEPVTTTSGPHRLYRQIANKNKSKLNLAVIGGSKDGINSVALACSGHVALDDNNTGLDAGFGMGNVVKGWFNFNKEISVNDNLSVPLKLGAEGIVSLTQTDEYTNEILFAKTLSDNFTCIEDKTLVDPEDDRDYDLQVYDHYTFNNNVYSNNIVSMSLPRHNIYASGTAGIKYTNDRGNFSAGLNLTGGAHIKMKPVTKVDCSIDMAQNASYSQGPYTDSGYYLEWDNPVEGTTITRATNTIVYEMKIREKLGIDQYVKSQTQIKPSVIPFAGINGTVEYNIPYTNWSFGVEGGYNWEFGENKSGSGIYGLGTIKCNIK